MRFKFDNTVNLIDFLSSLDNSSLQSVRNIAVRNHPLPLYTDEGKDSYSTYDFAALLELFPGLQLSMLEVQDTYHVPGSNHDSLGCEAAYAKVENLIKADGFKELRYKSDSCCFMMPKEIEVSSRIKDGSTGRGLHLPSPQPSAWDKLIKERDGKESGAKVEMFRHSGDELVEPAWEFESDPISRGLVHWNTVRPGAIEVRVQRGAQTQLTQSGQCKNGFNRSLHELFMSKTWHEIKKQGFVGEVDDDKPGARLREGIRASRTPSH